MNYRQLQSMPDGGVVAACGDIASYDEPVAVSFSPTGGKRTEVYTTTGSWYSHLSCGSSVVTKAGLIISQGRTSFSTTETVVRASDPSGVVWSHRVSGCSDADTPIYSNAEYAPAMDVVFYTTGCGRQIVMVALSASTGQVKFRAYLGDLRSDTSVKSYDDGFVYYDNAGKFVYLDNRGRRDDAKSVAVDPTYWRDWAVGAKGNLAAVTLKKWDACSAERIVTFRSASGAITTRTLHTYSACDSASRLVVMSDGSAAFFDQTTDTKFLRIVPVDSSKPTVDVPIDNWSGGQAAPLTMLADTNGHVMLHFDYTSASGQWHTMALMYGLDGVLQQKFTTESFGSRDTFFSGTSAMALSQDTMYLLVKRHAAGQPTTAAIYKIPFMGAGMDYPRGASFKALLTKPTFNYVAMGDSFSSGEGVEPFDKDTAVKGKNECHRSKYAYPRLLGSTSGLRLNLGAKGFAACSGATTSAITLGYNSEGAQIDKLTATTDLVTMTIGGNNVPFEDFAYACVFPNPAARCSGKAYKEAMAGVTKNVTPRVEYALGAVRDRLTNLGSDATVLVAGYPHMVPEKWVADSNGCWWFEPDELTAIRKLTDALNSAVKKQVDKFGGRFHFVSATEKTSPFRGHELCRRMKDKSPEFFNNVNLKKPKSYIFHPNKDGQMAYARLFAASVIKYGLAA